MKEKYIQMPIQDLRITWNNYLRSKKQMEQTPYYISMEEREALVDALITRLDKKSRYIERLEKTISLLTSHVEERLKDLET